MLEIGPQKIEKRRACGHDAPKRGNQPGLLFQGRSNLTSGDGTRYTDCTNVAGAKCSGEAPPNRLSKPVTKFTATRPRFPKETKGKLRKPPMTQLPMIFALSVVVLRQRPIFQRTGF